MIDREKSKVEAVAVREGRPVPVIDCRSGAGIDAVAAHLERDVLFLS